MVSLPRDMGVSPPRQNHVVVQPPGATVNEQLEVILDGWRTFGFPAVSTEDLARFRQAAITPLRYLPRMLAQMRASKHLIALDSTLASLTKDSSA
jgi:hypothetical protein